MTEKDFKDNCRKQWEEYKKNRCTYEIKRDKQERDLLLYGKAEVYMPTPEEITEFIAKQREKGSVINVNETYSNRKLSKEERQILRNLLFIFLEETLYDVNEPISHIITATQVRDEEELQKKNQELQFL